jgi:2-aminoethylphosphonate-pyruvate transaminase
MNVVILAAGVGRRLRPLTHTLPKAFLPIEGKPLIHYSLENLDRYGFKEVTLVVGYKASYFQEQLGDHYKGISLHYILNPKYQTTGSMYSLSQIQGVLDDDILLLESDLLYEPEALGDMLHSPQKDVILVAGLSGSGDEVYICVDETKRVIDLGKNIPEKNKKKAIGEFVGISKLSKQFLKKLFETVQKDRNINKAQYHYEECIFKTGQLGYPVYALYKKNLLWIEIDTENDLHRAREGMYPRIERKYYFLRHRGPS